MIQRLCVLGVSYKVQYLEHGCMITSLMDYIALHFSCSFFFFWTSLGLDIVIRLLWTASPFPCLMATRASTHGSSRSKRPRAHLAQQATAVLYCRYYGIMVINDYARKFEEFGVVAFDWRVFWLNVFLFVDDRLQASCISWLTLSTQLTTTCKVQPPSYNSVLHVLLTVHRAMSQPVTYYNNKYR